MTKNVFPDGRILCEKAKEIADQLGVTDFKATNGWLDRWKKRRNIKQMKVSGESGDVSGATVQSWKERLPHILEGYNACDIWNQMKLVVSGELSQTKDFAKELKSVKVVKSASRESPLHLL